MHSLGDVWHLGSEDLESLSGSLLCRIWRIWSLWGPVGTLSSLYAVTSLAALFLPIFMPSFGDVWHLGSEDLESLQVLGPAIFLHSLGQSLGPLGVHSVTCCKDLGSLQVLGPCSAGSGGSGSLGPSLEDLESLSLAALFLPIFMHSLGQSLGPLGVHSVTCCKDLGSLQVLGPCSAGSGGSGVSGAQCHLLHSFFLSLYAFLR